MLGQTNMQVCKRTSTCPEGMSCDVVQSCSNPQKQGQAPLLTTRVPSGSAASSPETFMPAAMEMTRWLGRM